MGANAATLARGAGLALASMVLQMLVSHAHVHAASSAAAVISKGDLLFLQNNMLLATSPEGVKRTQIQLASLQLGPLKSDNDGFYSDNRLIERVFPGATSADGRFSFNPANFNRPVTTNNTLDKAVLVVTDLIAGKVKHSIEVPLPGLPKGTYFNFNFKSDYLLPIIQGDAKTDLGYNANKYVAAGSPVGDQYPLFLVFSAWACKGQSDLQGQRYKKQFFTKYTYHARTGTLSWSGFRQTITSECPYNDKEQLSVNSGLALGAVGSTGYFIGGAALLDSPGNTVVYKRTDRSLKKVFTQPKQYSQNITKVTLLSASATDDSVKYAGVYNSDTSQAEIRLFGYTDTKTRKSSTLNGFKLKPDEYVSALANDAGALYALAPYRGPSESLKRLLTVYKIGPFALDVTGGKPTPTSSKQVFVLDSKWSGSIEAVGEPAKQLK